MALISKSIFLINWPSSLPPIPSPISPASKQLLVPTWKAPAAEMSMNGPHYNHWPWRAAFRQSTAISNACQLITDGLRIKVENFGHLMAQNLKQFRVSACRSADTSSNDMHYFHFAYTLLLCIQKLQQNVNRTDVAQLSRFFLPLLQYRMSILDGFEFKIKKHLMFHYGGNNYPNPNAK